MAGYMQDYSMSNNAFDAYCDGKAPWSKWNKKGLLEMIDEYDETHTLVAKIKDYPLDFLKTMFLTSREWHHTSAKYNETKFYEIKDSAVEGYAEDFSGFDEKYEQWLEEKANERSAKDASKQNKLRHGNLIYYVWNGSRRWGRYVQQTLHDVWVREEGKWLVAYDGKGKKANVITKRQIGGCASPRFEPTPVTKKKPEK